METFKIILIFSAGVFLFFIDTASAKMSQSETLEIFKKVEGFSQKKFSAIYAKLSPRFTLKQKEQLKTLFKKDFRLPKIQISHGVLFISNQKSIVRIEQLQDNQFKLMNQRMDFKEIQNFHSLHHKISQALKKNSIASLPSFIQMLFLPSAHAFETSDMLVGGVSITMIGLMIYSQAQVQEEELERKTQYYQNYYKNYNANTSSAYSVNPNLLIQPKAIVDQGIR